MPIHLRAEPGDYADACLLPGDPLRAKYIAETFLEDVRQVNAERGLLGYTGTWNGKPVSVQGTGMGCPSATIVFEELIQLGVKRLLRVGTCGGLQADHALGDLIVAISAVPADATATHLVGGEPHCPTASWELVHEAVHVAKHAKEPLRVGPIVSSDLFYNPDEGQYERWSKRGILAVEMEAAALFTLAAIRGVHGGCLLTVSDIVVEGEFVTDLGRGAPRRGRPDDAGRARHRNGGRRRTLAPAAPSSSSTRLRPPARQGSAGRRSRIAPPLGGSTATRSSPTRPGSSTSSRPRPCETARGASSSSAATAR